MNEQQEKQTEQIENEPSSDVIEENEGARTAEPMIFGMPGFYFRGAALGVAVGYILSGVIGLAFQRAVSANICAIVMGVAGYFIAKTIRKKRLAQQATEE